MCALAPPDEYPYVTIRLLANQKKLAFFKPLAENSKTSMNQSTVSRVSKYTLPGQLGQVDIWGPYHVGRSGFTHIFALIDAYSVCS